MWKKRQKDCKSERGWMVTPRKPYLLDTAGHMPVTQGLSQQVSGLHGFPLLTNKLSPMIALAKKKLNLISYINFTSGQALCPGVAG